MKNKFWNTFLFKYFLVSLILTSLISFIGYKFSTDFLEFIKPPAPVHKRPPPHMREDFSREDKRRGSPRMKDDFSRKNRRRNPPHLQKGPPADHRNRTPRRESEDRSLQDFIGQGEKLRPRGNFTLLGMKPSLFVAVAFGLPHLILFILHHLLTMYLFKKAANQTRDVLRELKSGNLKARFPKDGSDSFGTISNEVDEMADELEKLVLNLEKAEVQRKAILQELVHDVRTPITSLKSMLEVLIEHSSNMSVEEASSFLHSSLSEVKYFEKLVNDLLFISELAGQNDNISLSRIDLCDVLTEKMNSFKAQGIEILCDFKDCSPSYVLGDKQQLRRLFQNALGNAISFAVHRVMASIESEGHYWKILVIDDGKGISKERQDIFGEKFRSREVLKEQDDRISIGLGAVIMKKVALAHNGKISIGNIVENGKIKGARLEILIPKE